MSFTIQTFPDFSRLHANGRREVYFARYALARLRQAGEETGLLTSEAIRNQGCCVYAACVLGFCCNVLNTSTVARRASDILED